MSKKAKLVVVFPVYNGAKTLRDSLECVANQSFFDFNAIILENCSTDESLRIAQEFCDNDSRFKIVANEHHLTAIENIAKAIEIGASEGEYFCLRACDDYSSQDFFFKLVQALDENPAKQLAACATKLTGTRGVRIKTPSPHALNFLERYRRGEVPRNLTFPSEWIYNVYKSSARNILMERWSELGNPWALASYVVAAFVVRDLVVYVEGPTYDFTEGSGSESRYGAKTFRDKITQRLRYTFGCYKLRKELPKKSILTSFKFLRMCWNDSRRKTRYRLLWIF